MTSRINILLVEDNRGDQVLITKYLAQHNSPQFVVVTSSSLSEAYTELESKSFDVILLDLSLPDSHGFETFIRVQSTYPHLPIIILTGLDNQDIAGQAVAGGAQDYLVKNEYLQFILTRSILYGIERKNRLNKDLELAKAQIRMQTMQTFMQDVTHDLKTPLSIIMLSTELLKHYVPMDNPKVVNHINKLTSQSNRLQDMIDGILEMSQLNILTKIAPEQLNKVNLNYTVQQILEKLTKLAQAKAIHLQQPEDNAIHIQADEEMIGQMLVNLVENAIMHTPENGQVTVKLSQTETEAIIQVIDTGQGIPTESLPYIFDRFYRVDKSRNSNTGASGLGLSIVKRIVDLHGGEITVTSEPTVGTEFTITLPLVSNIGLTRVSQE